MTARPTALVTGASAGIGEAYATQLARAGHDIVLVARRKDRLDAVAAKLRETGANVEVLVADLTDAAGLRSVEARVARDDMALVVNNAGFGGYARFATLDPAVADSLIEVHIRSITRITRAALTGFIKRDAGAVINVSSLLAFSGTLPTEPLPGRAVYGGAKSYLVTFTQLLAGELAGTKVRMQVCCPGVVATEFHAVQNMNLQMPKMTADDLVRGSLAALARNEVVCVPALEDATAIDRVGEAQRVLMGAARTPELAPRYRG